MEERDFYEEKPETRTHTLTCPHCGKADEYQIGWLVRRKKNSLSRNADERDRARFAKGAVVHDAHRRRDGLQKYPLPQAL